MIETVSVTQDWTTFFSILPSKVRGHTQTSGSFKRNQEACHLFRFMRRGDIADTEPIESDFPDPPHQNDIVLGVKFFMALPTYAQPLKVFCPNKYWMDLPKACPGPAELGTFSDRERREFLKTSTAIRKTPWHMDKAADLLMNIANDTPMPRTPLDCDWIFNPMRPMVSVDSLTKEDLVWSDRAPQRVEVEYVPPRRARADPAPQHEDPALLPVPATPDDPPGPVMKRPALKRPAAAAGVRPDRLGCSRCRYAAMGCKRCRDWAGR